MIHLHMEKIQELSKNVMHNYLYHKTLWQKKNIFMEALEYHGSSLMFPVTYFSFQEVSFISVTCLSFLRLIFMPASSFSFPRVIFY